MHSLFLIFVFVLMFELIRIGIAVTCAPKKEDICGLESCRASRVVSDTTVRISERTIRDVDTVLPIGGRQFSRAAIFEPSSSLNDPCEYCIGADETPKCDKAYIEKKDLQHIEKLISENRDLAQKMWEKVNGDINELIQESNRKMIEQMIANQLKNDNWFKKLDKTMQQIFTEHAMMRLSQDKMAKRIKAFEQSLSQISVKIDDLSMQLAIQSDVQNLVNGIAVYDLLVWDDLGGLTYNPDGSGFTYYKDFIEYYDTGAGVNLALNNVLNVMMGEDLWNGKTIWELDNGKYCQNRDYFYQLLTFTFFLKCKVKYLLSDKCLDLDINRFNDKQQKIDDAYQKFCWVPPTEFGLLDFYNGTEYPYSHTLEAKKNSYASVRCRTKHSIPAATITWKLDGKPLKLGQAEVMNLAPSYKREKDSNGDLTGMITTTSSLQFKTGDKDSAYLTCLAEHPALRLPMQRKIKLILDGNVLPCWDPKKNCTELPARSLDLNTKPNLPPFQKGLLHHLKQFFPPRL